MPVGVAILTAPPLFLIATQSINDVKTETRPAVETWTVMAEERYRKRWFVFFDPIPHLHGGGSNGSEAVRPQSTSSTSKKLEMKNERQRMMKEAEKELEKANWQTLYQVTNNSLGASLDDVRRRAQGDNLKVLRPLINEIIKPSSRSKVDDFVRGLSPSEQNEFTILMRSLSIAFEKAQTAYNSEYLIKYVPKEIKTESIFINDPFASSISPPIRYAPPKQPFRPRTKTPMRAPTPHMLKPIAAPKPVGKVQFSLFQHFPMLAALVGLPGAQYCRRYLCAFASPRHLTGDLDMAQDLLSWAGSADIPNSSYR